MNERIRELIVKAGFPKFDEMYVVSDGAELEQFAQLIVRECAGIYDKIDNGNQHQGTDDYLLALQKHFRVE